jgi:hypothetical protein
VLGGCRRFFAACYVGRSASCRHRRPAQDLLRYAWCRPGIYLACPSGGPRYAQLCRQLPGRRGSAVPQLEPGHRPPAAPPPARALAVFRLTTGGPQLRHPAAAVSDLDPDHAACGPDRLPRSARTTVPYAVTEQVTSRAASSQHGCPARAPPTVNARAHSARPATVTLSRTTALATSAPAFPGSPRGPGNHPGPQPAHGHARPARRPASKPGTRRQRGPSVAVRETADGAHRP